MSNTKFSRRVAVLGLGLVGLFIGSLLWLQTTALAQSSNPHPLLTETPFNCPPATQELFWVNPVTSPTTLLTQTITTYTSSNGDTLTVTAASGTFVVTGTNPSAVPITLFANATHHLTVTVHIRPVQVNGCVYGNYTMSRNTAGNGAPLTIVQEFHGPRTYLPMVVRSANPALSAVVP